MLVWGRMSQTPSPNLDFLADGDDNGGDTTPPLRGFRGRWLSRDRNWQDEAEETGHFDEEVGGPQWTGRRRAFLQILKNLLVS